MTPEFKGFLRQVRERTDAELSDRLALGMAPQSRLREAMRYAVLNGGKRVRPALCFAAAAVEKGDAVLANNRLVDAACALELIHSYSLIHDDLPAMDDDDLRRGKPTTHIAFDEATAVLAGDALQTKAFEILATSEHLDPETKIFCIKELAEGAGEAGMCGGQAIDLAAVGTRPNLETLSEMHRLKTGALIKSSVLIGALASGQQDQPTLDALATYAESVGLAFQVKDDILDATADTSTLGKRQGADAKRDKPTYVSHLGIEGAERKLTALRQEARAALDQLHKPCDFLAALIDYIVDRDA